MSKPTQRGKEKGPVVRASFNAPKSRKRVSAVSNVPLIDSHVNYQQFILCVPQRSMQVLAWINHAKTSRESLIPFLDGYELRAGVGRWFETFSVYDGDITCWCDAKITANVPKVDISRAALGILAVGRREVRV